MITAHKNGPAGGKTREANVRNQPLTEGHDPLMFAHTKDSAPAPRITWTVIAVITALVVTLAANPLITDVAIWGAAVIVTRLAVVDRRRARRAAHRATREALVVANSSHARREREAVAA